jgi:type I restriction enzyme, S subunit
MKQGWEIKKLGDVCETGAGGTPLKAHKDFYEGGTIPWLMSGEVSQGEVFEARNFITEKGLKNSSAKLFPINTVLVAMYGATAGQVGILKFEACTNQAVCGILPNDKTIPEYLFYCFLSKKEELVSQAVGGAQPNISQIKIRNTKIPLPPLPEQQRIVSILDKTFSVIERSRNNAEQNLRNAKELFESYLQGVFEKKGDGWEEKMMGEVFDIGSSKRIMEKDWTVDGVPFYGGKEIVKLAKFGFVVSNSYISEEKYNEYASKYDMPQNGDILITARGTIGIGYIVKKGDKFYYKDGNIISMRAKMPTNPEFILYALKSNAIYDQLRKLTGATVSHLPIEKAKLLVVMIPNFSTQYIVVEKIKEMEAETKKLEAIYQQKINDLEEFKKSILQKAFSGELRCGELAEPKTEKEVSI